ncbi:MAG: histidinol-phosphatase [Deltaproteobacteria bacterium]|nr:histidinol-phosphatase [Deltaproteobacteria bacterium]
MSELSAFKNFCRLLADESGRIIRKYYRTPLAVETKSDASPVTIADRAAEERMRELIEKEFPDHGIMGEEFGASNPEAEYQWVLDPIDGTKSFVCGVPLFGTLIALAKKGQPLLGLIHQPILNERLIGDNVTAELNGNPIGVRDCRDLSSAILLSTDHLDFGKYRTQAGFEALIRKVAYYRTWGDCYGYSLVAAGFADIMIDPVMNLWDLMALIPIIRGAGGQITDYRGHDPVKGDSIVATAGPLHDEVIKILNSVG